MSDSHDAHGHHGENVYPYTPHHFHTAKQHLESGKMGVWLFLVTEILFFAGLFCAYTIYRAQHPDIFYWSHFFLDTKWGAINTMVLIFSSFTAAWAVRNAQLGQMKLLKINIFITIGCAFAFMCVKYVEYSHKFHIGIFPAGHFDPHHYVWEEKSFKSKHPEAALAAEKIMAGLEERKAKVVAVRDEITRDGKALEVIPVQNTGEAPAAAPAAPAPATPPKADAAPKASAAPKAAQPSAAAAPAAEGDGSKEAPTEGEASEDDDAAQEEAAAEGEATEEGTEEEGAEGEEEAEASPAVPKSEELSDQAWLARQIRALTPEERKPLVMAGIIRKQADGPIEFSRPPKAGIFFSIYFFMTGLHGFHVLVGIGLWVWMLFIARRRDMGSKYYGPIEFTALYWHLVDLIWIYLFPMLYLIH